MGDSMMKPEAAGFIRIPDRSSNEEEILRVADQVAECTKQQQREVDSLEELDELLARLTRVNEERKDKVSKVRKRMRRLDSQL